jgi:HSP20 family protein
MPFVTGLLVSLTVAIRLHFGGEAVGMHPLARAQGKTRSTAMLSVWNPFYDLVHWGEPVCLPTHASAEHYVPAIDVVEKESAYELVAEVPGVSADDLEVKLEAGVLSILGHREHKKTDERGGYRRVERRSGSFCRSFHLPKDVRQEAVSADLKDGVLTVTIPKGEEAQPRRIAVKSALQLERPPAAGEAADSATS